MAIADAILSDLVSRGVDLERVKNTYYKKDVEPILRDLEKEIDKQLIEIDPTEGRGTLDRQRRLNNLLQETRTTINTHYGTLRSDHAELMKEVVEVESEDILDLYNSRIGFDLMNVHLTPKQIESVAAGSLIEGAPSAAWWARQDATARRVFEDQMRQGLLLGENLQQLRNRLKGTKEFGFSDGMSAKWKRDANALIRTSIQNASNDARLRTYAENSDVIGGLQWVSTLDSRTTHICIGLDGRQWRYNEDGVLVPVGHDISFPGATAHWGCRSTQIATTLSWDDLAGPKAWPRASANRKGAANIEELFQNEVAKGEKGRQIRRKLKDEGFSGNMLEREFNRRISIIRGRTRASLDGQVPEDITFDQFIAQKGDNFAKNLLGAGRFQLWKDKKITTKQLIGNNTKPLTVRQLQQKYNQAAYSKALDSVIASVPAAVEEVVRELPQSALMKVAETDIINEKPDWGEKVDAAYNPNEDTIKYSLEGYAEEVAKRHVLHEIGHVVEHKNNFADGKDLIDERKKLAGIFKGLPFNFKRADRNSVFNAILPVGEHNPKISVNAQELDEFMDLIGAITRGEYGFGHRKKVYTNLSDARSEIYGHALVAKYYGNRYIEQYMPSLLEYIDTHIE